MHTYIYTIILYGNDTSIIHLYVYIPFYGGHTHFTLMGLSDRMNLKRTYSFVANKCKTQIHTFY